MAILETIIVGSNTRDRGMMAIILGMEIGMSVLLILGARVVFELMEMWEV